MEEKLVTLAIRTFQKAQMIKMLLESEGIEVYLHNINLIQPVISAGVRVRIKESDLPAALKIIEEHPLFYSEEQLLAQDSKKILIPVDFSDYSEQACEIGFHFAQSIGAEIVLLHTYLVPIYPNPMLFNENPLFDETLEQESIQSVKTAQEGLDRFVENVRKKIDEGSWPDIPFSAELGSGLPEEVIISYTRNTPVKLIIMGTRGKDRKDIDLIGSVTAEVINQTKTPVLAIPENTPFRSLSEIGKIAFGTSFDQKDLIAVDSLIKMFMSFDIEYYLFHLSHKPDTWDEIKLAGIKEYFAKQYPDLPLHYEIIDANDFLVSMERFIKTNGIDMISLATHKRNLLTRLFNPSVAHKMLFHTDTPLLAFHC